ncbi:MAG: amino acid ABC transporter substrate-binding protein/permease [Lactobacillales bacterium]|jgi:polar amino acid transport system substrate-binding protein|nr:amino acid ABC transporter substrate-binding protein/permease [Lactobacillales bacterium]
MKRVFLPLFILLMSVVGLAVPTETRAENTTSKKEKYVIASDSTYAPFEFQNADQTYVGIDVDLMNAIAKEEGFKIEMKFPGFQAAVDQVQAAQADGMIAGMSITDERKKSFEFSNPYFDSGIEIAVKTGNKDVKSYADLKGKKVGVKNGTTSQAWLDEHKKEYGYTIKTFDAGDQMYDALNISAVQAIMDDAPVVDYAINQGKELATPVQQEIAGQYGFAVKKGQNPELVQMFNDGLKKLKANGEYDKIVAKYVSKGEITTKVEPKKDVYIIASDSTYAPFEFQNAKGVYEGIDVSLMNAIAKEEGFKIEMKFPGFQAAVDQVQASQADGMIAGMSITEEREKAFDFSEPYFDSGIELAVKKGNKKIQSYEDLKGKKVGVKNGTTSQAWLDEHKKEYGYTVKTFDAGDQMYDALNIDAVQAVMDDAPVVDYAVTQGKELDTPIKQELAGQYGFAVKKGQNPELIEMFNQGLNKLKESGEYEKIVAEYVGLKSEEKEKKADKAVDETSFIGLIQNNWKALLTGLGKTLLLTLVSFALALVVGIIFGLFSVSPSKILRGISIFYVDIIRGVPLMVLAVFIFYGIPNLIHHPLNDFVAGVIALTLNASAYIAEIVRGGINAVPAGQMEASRSLGLGYSRTMQKIILPQAIKIMIPSFVNQFVISLKDTTIISVLGVIELLQAGKIIVARNLQSFKVYLIVAILYLIVITALTKLSKVLEKKVK